MVTRNAKLFGGLAVMAASLWGMAAVAEAQTTIIINCGAGGTIASVLAKTVRPGSIILVSGTCNENVVIAEQHLNITLDGQGTATINGPGTDTSVILIRGRGITIKNFASITGVGNNGINVQRGGAAIIDNNVIQSISGGNGILVNTSGNARITNNTIQSNANHGVVIQNGASARIGFIRRQDTVASPNTIQNNSNRGVVVTAHSTAEIFGNTISGNLSDGVLVSDVSQSDMGSNVISNNGAYGINFGRNSGVNLGSDTGTTIFDNPNSGSGNVLFGIRCFINSYGEGRQGTLTGNSGAVDFTSTSCINSLIP